MFAGENIMNQKSDCIVCGNKGREVVRNNLPMFLCDTCGLFWRTSFELGDNHYEQRGFELENKGKIGARYANSLERIDLFRKYADLNNISDIGCGEGVFLKALSQRGYKNVIGLEPSVVARDFALINNLKVFEGEIQNLDASFFVKNNIHVVTMFHVVEHLKDPQDVLKMIFDNLKKGDRLIVETPDTSSRIFINTNYQNEFVYPEHLYYFNKNNLRSLLKKIGFTTIATGNRDFNERNLSIRGALARLGVVDFPQFGERRFEKKLTGTILKENRVKSDILRTLVRYFLSRIVKLCNRGNYVWIIVKK